jgi:hypothetical protein
MASKRIRPWLSLSFQSRGVIPSVAAFQAERGNSLRIVPGEIPPAAELRRGSGLQGDNTGL